MGEGLWEGVEKLGVDWLVKWMEGGRCWWCSRCSSLFHQVVSQKCTYPRIHPPSTKKFKFRWPFSSFFFSPRSPNVADLATTDASMTELCISRCCFLPQHLLPDPFTHCPRAALASGSQPFPSVFLAWSERFL